MITKVTDDIYEETTEVKEQFSLKRLVSQIAGVKAQLAVLEAKLVEVNKEVV